jgi:hypothetical protein
MILDSRFAVGHGLAIAGNENLSIHVSQIISSANKNLSILYNQIKEIPYRNS